MAFCWYFSREEIENKTPSRDDGIPLLVENRYRRDGARFIINASNTLGLHYDTVATGVVFFHRFFMVQSFKHFDRWVVATACLLLAGKVEETPKKCKDIIKVSRSLLNDQQMAQFGSNPKEELLTHERILLQTIKFDLQVEHPYTYLLKFGKSLKGDKAKIEKLVQMAWTFVNDGLCTTLCLQWESRAIAVAFLYLAGKLSKFDLQASTQSKSRSWWRQFVDTLDSHDLESICHQVLDIYGEQDRDGQQSEEKPMQAQKQPHHLVQASAVRTTPPPHNSQPPPPPPPPVPITQATATASVFQQRAPPTSTLHTQASFLTQGGLTSFGLVNPLQALQNILPQPPNIPLAYSTLNVSVAGVTRPNIPQPTYGIQSTSPMLPSKSLLPTTPTVGGPAVLGGGYIYTQPVQIPSNAMLGTQNAVLTPPATKKLALDPSSYRPVIPMPTTPIQILNKPLLPGIPGRIPHMTHYQSPQLQAQNPLTPMGLRPVAPSSQSRPQQPGYNNSMNWMR